MSSLPTRALRARFRDPWGLSARTCFTVATCARAAAVRQVLPERTQVSGLPAPSLSPSLSPKAASVSPRPSRRGLGTGRQGQQCPPAQPLRGEGVTVRGQRGQFGGSTPTLKGRSSFTTCAGRSPQCLAHMGWGVIQGEADLDDFLLSSPLGRVWPLQGPASLWLTGPCQPTADGVPPHPTLVPEQ